MHEALAVGEGDDRAFHSRSLRPVHRACSQPGSEGRPHETFIRDCPGETRPASQHMAPGVAPARC